VSTEDIDRLVADRSLERQSFRDEDIVSLWSKAATSYADAGVPGLSTDGAFQNIYKAALQASIATLAAHGLRVKSTANHYKTFYALQKLTDALEPHGMDFQEMRAVRNDSVYEPTHDEAEVTESLLEARASMPASLAALRTAIISVRPGLAARLPHIR
jgi:exosome complex RNA-binding protein Rrp42 (RNase PH superfamily)